MKQFLSFPQCLFSNNLEKYKIISLIKGLVLFSLLTISLGCSPRIAAKEPAPIDDDSQPTDIIFVEGRVLEQPDPKTITQMPANEFREEENLENQWILHHSGKHSIKGKEFVNLPVSLETPSPIFIKMAPLDGNSLSFELILMSSMGNTLWSDRIEWEEGDPFSKTAVIEVGQQVEDQNNSLILSVKNLSRKMTAVNIGIGSTKITEYNPKR